MDLKDYYNRILPVVGEAFKGKTIAVINPVFSCLIADALARCGLTKQLYFLSANVEKKDVLALSYGINTVGLDAGEALQNHIVEHNTMETAWDIQIRPEKTREDIAEALSEHKVDLIIGGGDYETAALVNFLSRATGIPASGFMLFDGLLVESMIFIVDSDLPDCMPEYLADMLSRKKNKIVSNPKLQHRLAWLGAIDVMMNFSKALLLRGTAYERKDLEDLLFKQRRNVILRGTFEWPWQIYYVNPNKKQDFLKKVFSSSYYMPPVPIEALENDRVMVLGCGTGSLIIGELVNYYRHLLMVDYKHFSIYNPVRQLVGVNWIGEKIKPYALQDYLVRFFSLTGGKEEKFISQIVKGDLARTYYSGSRSISAAELCLKEFDEKSIAKFNRLLDWFKPTLVIVATGRSYDDNFTACEILRKRGIKHIIPSAFSGATHYKVVVVDGESGPCYECFQNNLTLDMSPGIKINEDMRTMLYSDPDDPTQPATIIETWPSAHLALRLSIELSLNKYLRSAWFAKAMQKEKICFVGGNNVEKIWNEDAYVYGVEYPGQVVIYGVEDIIGYKETFTCDICGRSYKVCHLLQT
ncbi:hypothetical protein KAU09_01285 [Candidatus Parcubacteria bacterium]|nr:hypothetical protein [Candidatus Parcubacteria bacterium]